jgi:hypothetical protein
MAMIPVRLDQLDLPIALPSTGEHPRQAVSVTKFFRLHWQEETPNAEPHNRRHHRLTARLNFPHAEIQESMPSWQARKMKMTAPWMTNHSRKTH